MTREATPCEKLGYHEGDSFRVLLDDHPAFRYGEEVTLVKDDGTSMPRFISNAGSKAYIALKAVEKIPQRVRLGATQLGKVPQKNDVRASEAARILQQGIDHMVDRASTYDQPEGERSMAATVKAFSATTGIAMTEEQGWHFMVLLKLVRSQQGGYRVDNYEDAAAYCGLMGEAAKKERGDKR